MRKVTLSLMGICTVAGFYFITSCKREISPDSSSNRLTIAKVNAWLDEQKRGKSPGKAANIDLVKENLDFSNLRFEKSGNDEQLLVIPINEQFKMKTEIDLSTSTDLLLMVDKSGNIRNGNVVLYTAENKGANKIPENTYYHIFNTAEPEWNGKFQFLSITGRPQYQLEYKNKHLISSGLYQPKEKTATSDKTATDCYDWYLVTTWYDISGNVTDQTYVYLYTTCGDCQNAKYMSLCSDDGGGGDTGCCISDPTAQLSVKAVSQADPGACGLETIDPLTGLPTKTCTHRWYFTNLSILWYVWKYGSAEQAVEVKVSGIWKFKSVTHMGGITSGTVPPCINSHCTISSVVPSFSESVARVNLVYTVSIAYPCAISGGLQSQTSSASSQWLAA
jgi:hypothetical protein